MNESEAEFLCGFPVASLAQAGDARLTRSETWLQNRLVTLGAHGACVTAGGPPLHIPAFSVQPVDTTAAGDVFCGALAVSLVEGRSLAESVRFASAAAAISVTQLGAQPSIPARQEIDRFLREQTTCCKE